MTSKLPFSLGNRCSFKNIHYSFQPSLLNHLTSFMNARVTSLMDDPLPDEDVDLFVDNIEWENAEAILLLNRTGGTIVVERTLGYLGKYLGHGIRPIFGLHL